MTRPRMLARRAVAVALSGCALVLMAFVFDAAPLFVPGVALVLIGVAHPRGCGRVCAAPTPSAG